MLHHRWFNLITSLLTYDCYITGFRTYPYPKSGATCCAWRRKSFGALPRRMVLKVRARVLAWKVAMELQQRKQISKLCCLLILLLFLPATWMYNNARHNVTVIILFIKGLSSICRVCISVYIGIALLPNDQLCLHARCRVFMLHQKTL